MCLAVQRVPEVILLTNDADNRSRAQAEGLQAMTVQVGALGAGSSSRETSWADLWQLVP